jgi:hypothetical protein
MNLLFALALERAYRNDPRYSCTKYSMVGGPL